MARLMTVGHLRDENRAYRGTGGVSENNRDLGFCPAFLDSATGIVYLSRNPDGSRACCHRLDGLPEALTECNAEGRACGVRDTVIAGFERGGCFFTREQAARYVDGP